MANGTRHFKDFSIVRGNVRANVRLDRLDKQLEDAQKALDMAVMTSMVPFMPMQTGNFIDRTIMTSTSLAGTGIVCAAVPPMGRMLYEGKVMADSVTGRGAFAIENSPGEFIFRFRRGAKLVATGRDLKYSKAAHPNVRSRWFDEAKRKDLKVWVGTVKRIAGGGANA